MNTLRLAWCVVPALAVIFSHAHARAQVAPTQTAPASVVPAQSAGPAVLPPSDAGVAPPRSAARDAYARGQALFADAKYAEAKAAFEEAYASMPNPIVLLSSAECDIRLGNIEQAHALLQRYLVERPDAPDRVQVERKVAELSAMPALVMLTSEPRDATIQLDDQALGVRTPAEILVPAGEHRISLSHPGYEPTTELLRTRMGARHGLRLILRRTQDGPASSPTSKALAPAAERGSRAPLWIAGILGGVGMATGTVLGVMALNERAQFNAMPSARSADRGERLALFADVAFGVGAIALITAAVLYVTDGAGHPDRVATAALRPFAVVRLSPFPSARGAGVTASAHF